MKQPKIIVPDAPKPQEQARSPVEASKNDQKPAQENAQPPPLQAPGKPEDPVAKVGMEKQMDGKIEGAEDDNLSPRTPRKEKDQVLRSSN